MQKRALYSQLVKYYDRTPAGREATEILAARGYEVAGVDISEDMLRIARRTLKGRAKFIRVDMRDLDAVVDGAYDAATCLFSNLLQPDGFRREAEDPGSTSSVRMVRASPKNGLAGQSVLIR